MGPASSNTAEVSVQPVQPVQAAQAVLTLGSHVLLRVRDPAGASRIGYDRANQYTRRSRYL